MPKKRSTSTRKRISRAQTNPRRAIPGGVSKKTRHKIKSNPSKPKSTKEQLQKELKLKKSQKKNIVAKKKEDLKQLKKQLCKTQAENRDFYISLVEYIEEGNKNPIKIYKKIRLDYIGALNTEILRILRNLKRNGANTRHHLVLNTAIKQALDNLKNYKGE